MPIVNQISRWKKTNRLIIIVPNIKKLMTTDDRKFAERFSLFVKQTFKYYLVGASGVGIGLVLLYLLTDIVGIWYVISQSIAIGIAMTSNFTLHKFWTYRKESIEGRTLVKYVKYVIICLIGTVMQLGLTYGLVENLSVYYIHAAVISIGLAASFNYYANRKWTFGIKF